MLVRMRRGLLFKGEARAAGEAEAWAAGKAETRAAVEE